MADEHSTAGLVTTPAAATTTAKPKAAADTPFTAPNPDPAHALDPIKAGQRVSSPRASQKKDRKPARKPAATKAKRRDAASIAAAVARMTAGRAAKAATAKSTASRDEGAASYALAVAHEVDSFPDMKIKEVLQLRLADGDLFIDGAIDCPVGTIVPAASGCTYTKDIDIGPDGDPVRVTEAWLVADSGDAVRCAVGPINGGGGSHARIPAGHLKF